MKSMADMVAGCGIASGGEMLDPLFQDGLLPRHPTVTGWPGAVRRFSEVLVASISLLFLAPLLITIFALIKMQDPGPALFGHWRVGRGGRRFRCWKFRTMVLDAEQRLQDHFEDNPRARLEWNVNQKLRIDPRVTRMGLFLHKSGLEELPQLLNVLSGEMSLVGPRPIVAAEIQTYGRAYADYMRVRPGLTGLWQVSEHNGTSYSRRVAIDTDYVRRWSFELDFAILLRTVEAVLTFDSSA